MKSSIVSTCHPHAWRFIIVHHTSIKAVWHRFIQTGTQPLCLSFICYPYMLPCNSLEAFSQCHSLDKGFYHPIDNRIFYLHYDNPEASVYSVSIVPTLPCRLSSVHRPVRDGFLPTYSQSRPTYGQDFPWYAVPIHLCSVLSLFRLQISMTLCSKYSNFRTNSSNSCFSIPTNSILPPFFIDSYLFLFFAVCNKGKTYSLKDNDFPLTGSLLHQ